jgi:hypothetical protein
VIEKYVTIQKQAQENRQVSTEGSQSAN